MLACAGHANGATSLLTLRQPLGAPAAPERPNKADGRGEPPAERIHRSALAGVGGGLSTSNRIASITPASGPVRSFTFDANGSTTADGNNTYSYDTRGRMVQGVSSIGTTSYQVNALGHSNRVSRDADRKNQEVHTAARKA